MTKNVKQEITLKKQEVCNVLKHLKKWVVMPVDKDSGSTYLMCPRLFWDRVNKLYNCEGSHYEEIKDMVASDILTNLSRELSHLGHLPLTRKSRPGVPYGYLLPKEKDLKNKDRPVVSYFFHPEKGKLNIVARAFMWALKQLQTQGVCNSFSLFNTGDYANIMSSASLNPGTKNT